MKILVTCPGRHGDILWSLPAVRALHEATGAEIDLGVSEKYAAVAGLVGEQSYIRACYGMVSWEVEETAPMTPTEPPTIPDGYDRVIHLGYRGWPMHPLPIEHYWRMQEQLPPELALPPVLDLQRPWLRAFEWQLAGLGPGIALVFTEEWFELKAGIVLALAKRFRHYDPHGSLAHPTFFLCVPEGGSRWHEVDGQNLPPNVATVPCSFHGLAQILTACRVVVADNSAGHVVARGVGKPVVMVEPSQPRHHPIFYPYGTSGGGVELVLGSDRQPTFDARHVGDVLADALERKPTCA